MKEDDIYKNVPGKGKVLLDGTWWTNSNYPVGHRVITHHYYRMIDNRTLYSRPKESRCVERRRIDGRQFCRWEPIEHPEWKKCVLYTDMSVDYA